MEYKSKTEKKKDAIALQDLGEKLVKLPDEQLKGIDMPEELSNAVRQTKTIKSHGALKRQMQFIGTLMRKIDPAPVREAIDGIEQGNYKKTIEFKETERYRDELMAGNKELMDEILLKYPSADRQQLSQLVRNALKERKDNKPPKAFRALFRYLKEIKKSAV
jgi:ribosome-associated protein